LAYIVSVPRPELAAYSASRTGPGMPAFRVQTDGEAPDLFLIQSFEPLEATPDSLGYDIGRASDIQRATAERARDQGVTAMTEILRTLGQGEPQERRVALMLPVYRPQAPLLTQEERRRAHRGWVSAAIHVNGLQRAVLQGADAGIAVEVFQGRRGDPRMRLFGGGEGVRGLAGLRQDVVFTAGGQDWLLRVGPGTTFTLAPAFSWPERTLAGGLVISILLFGLVWSVLGTRARARAMADLMTHSLRESEARLRAVIGSAPLILFEVDAAGQVIFFEGRGVDSKEPG